MKFRAKRASVVFLAFVIVAGAGRPLQVAADGKANVVKVGVMLCQTGACAETGTSALKGIELAASEINGAGGILGRRIELVVQDTKEADSGLGSVTAFQSLTNNKDIKFIIGPTWDVGGLPLVSLMQKRKDLLLVSPSVGVSEFSADADNIFNLWPLDELGVRRLAQLSAKRGWRTAAVLSAQNNWAQTQARAFEREFSLLGAKVVSVEEPMSTQTDIRGELLKISSKKPDVVLFTMFAHLPTAVKQLRQMGYSGHYLSVQIDQDRIKASGEAIEGAIFPKFGLPSEKFVAAFEEKFSSAPQMAADTGYDALFLLLHAAKFCNNFEPLCLKDACARLSFDGASGRVRFSAERTVLKDIELFEVRNSKMSKLEGGGG